jgi:excisionase family DNA binding protein
VADTCPTAEALLELRDLARLLKVSTRTVTRLVARGELPPPLRLGRLRRWRPADLRPLLGGAGA